MKALYLFVSALLASLLLTSCATAGEEPLDSTSVPDSSQILSSQESSSEEIGSEESISAVTSSDTPSTDISSSEPVSSKAVPSAPVSSQASEPVSPSAPEKAASSSQAAAPQSSAPASQAVTPPASSEPEPSVPAMEKPDKNAMSAVEYGLAYNVWALQDDYIDEAEMDEMIEAAHRYTAELGDFELDETITKYDSGFYLPSNTMDAPSGTFGAMRYSIDTVHSLDGLAYYRIVKERQPDVDGRAYWKIYFLYQ